jgi:hypothetical protein
MPIRVEHGPNLAPVGQLAYQTGQLEYRNKRRTELERLAMQQAEMRQRAQMQQQSIAASLQTQKMSHMGAMQRLAMGQQFGQINAEQANQWNVQAAEQKREHDMGLAEQVGERAIDRVKFAQGLADDSDWKKAEWNWLTDIYDTGLNGNGKQNVQGLLTDRVRITNDPRVKDKDAALAQNMTQIQAAVVDPANKLGLSDEVGAKRQVGMMPDGNHMFNEERVSTGRGEHDWVKTPNLGRMIDDPNHAGLGPINKVKSEITPGQWFEATKHFYTDENGTKWLSRPDQHGNWSDEQVGASQAEIAKDRKLKEQFDRDIKIRGLWLGLDEDVQRTQYDNDYGKFKREGMFQAMGQAPAGEQPAADQQPEPPVVTEEFQQVPEQFHPKKEFDHPGFEYATLQAYEDNDTSIYEVVPQHQKAVYEARQRKASTLEWSSEERGTVSGATIAAALRNQELPYGTKIDLSADNSIGGRAFAEVWRKKTGSTDLVVNDKLMWNALNPSGDPNEELENQIYTQKKAHFEYFGEPEDFQQQDFMELR